MEKLFLVIGCLFSISLLFACQSRKLNQSTKLDSIQINPAPLTEQKTDSLKNYLDLEREKRKKK